MAINAQIQTDTFTRKVASLSAQTVIEIKFGQDAGEVLAVCPQVSLTGCEVSSGRVNYGGRIVATLVYADGDGKLCRIQKGAEFSHFIDNEILAPAQRGDCALKCEKWQVKRDGSSYSVAVIVGATVDVYDSATRSYISSVEGAVCRTESAKFHSFVSFSGESEVDDDFDCIATDVLVPSAQALVLDCNVRAGVAEISGEIYLSLIAVRDGAPVCLDRIIPFKCELACDDAILSRKAYCRAEVRGVNVNCKVNEERGQCDVEANVTLGFAGHFYEEEETSYISDAFAEDCELGLEFKEEETFVDCDLKVYSERVNGLCATKAKLDYTCAFLAATLPNAEFARTEGGIEGSVVCTLLYEQAGEVRTTEVNLPFSVALPALSVACKEISVAVCGVSLRQRAEGECEGEAVLKITAADGVKNTVKYLAEVTEGEKKAFSDCALSVYIPAAGDGLWETAKRLSEAPDKIEKANPDLKFPLTGKERILIYRPKN